MKSILLIEDDQNDALLIKGALDKAASSYKFTHVKSLSEGLALLSADDFGVILADLNLPDSYGLETLKSIIAVRTDVPIIVCTNSLNEADGEEAIALGAQDYLNKDVISNAALNRIITFSIERHRLNYENKRLLRESEAGKEQAIRANRQVENALNEANHYRLEAEKALETAQHHEHLLESIAKIAGVGGWELDLKTNVPDWSAQTRAIHEVDDEYEPTLESALEFYPEEARANLQQILDEAIKVGASWDEEFPFVTAKGRNIWVRVIGQAIQKDGETIKLIGAFQDVSSEHKKREVLADALDQADKANRLKSEFLANMSHEIRTPLNGILGMAQLMQRTLLDDKQKKYAETIRSCGDALLALINDVLDISKIESGIMRLDNDAFNIDDVTKKAVDSVAGTALKKSLTVANERNFETPLDYMGDAKRIRQVLINLVGNAVKFTQEGGIKIRVEKLPKDVLKFSVLDTGAGIAADQQEIIFERFQQADGSATREHGGTGLGLAIAKDLVELMGGKIGVKSNLGEGATFWFKLPLKPAEAALNDAIHELQTVNIPPSSPAAKPDQEETIYPCRVLMAEDNPVNQEMVKYVLKQIPGVSLQIVENGLEALNKLGETEFDLVLMDINMPIMTGDDAIRNIRAKKSSYQDIPVVVLTANALASQRDDYLEAGANKYISKPIDIDLLIETVKSFATNKKPTTESAHQLKEKAHYQSGAKLKVERVGKMFSTWQG